MHITIQYLHISVKCDNNMHLFNSAFAWFENVITRFGGRFGVLSL